MHIKYMQCFVHIVLNSLADLSDEFNSSSCGATCLIIGEVRDDVRSLLIINIVS